MLVVTGRVEPWPVARFAEVTYETLAPIAAAADELELLLIGAGPRFARVDPGLQSAFQAHGVAVEAMDTGAACRTYNVLLGEGRAVAAALIAID